MEHMARLCVGGEAPGTADRYRIEMNLRLKKTWQQNASVGASCRKDNCPLGSYGKFLILPTRGTKNNNKKIPSRIHPYVYYFEMFYANVL